MERVTNHPLDNQRTTSTNSSLFLVCISSSYDLQIQGGGGTTHPTWTNKRIVLNYHEHSESNTMPYTYLCYLQRVLLINVNTISSKEIVQPRKTIYIKILNDGAHMYKGGCFYSMKARDTCTITS